MSTSSSSFLTIKPCGVGSSEFDSVQALHRKNSDTLGFFTNGAFQDHAAKGCIFVAKNAQDAVVGYIVFRIAKGRAGLVHLCVDQNCRGQGISRMLVAHLKGLATSRSLRGIGLFCRRDYTEATKMWPRLGFSPKGSKIGRGRDSHELTYWWLDLGEEDLFSLSTDTSKLQVVLDMNLLLDLNDSGRIRYGESRCLYADWLTDIITLCVVDETYTEINRNPDKVCRERTQGWARGHESLRHRDDVFEKTLHDVEKLFGHVAPNEREASDVRQVAMCIAAEADILLSYDKEILGHAEAIEATWGLKVMLPVDLITNLDSLERSAAYQPARLGGTEIRDERVSPSALDTMAVSFADQQPAHVFSGILRALLARPHEVDCRVIVASDAPVCLLAKERCGTRLVIRLLRMARHTLATTVARHVILNALMLAAKSGATSVEVSEPRVTGDLVSILQELGFQREGENWIKCTLSIVAPPTDVARVAADALNGLREPDAALALEPPIDAASVAEFESRFWPAKVTQVEMPTYVIPIEPAWARMLFDETSARLDFFHEKWSLILNRENVYYSGAVNFRFKLPARILWYVSARKGEVFSKQIRACSRLLDVEVGDAKGLYRKYRRLGVFERRHVLAVAKKGTGQALVMRFGDTELFDNEVSYEDTRKMGIRSQFPGPLEVSSKIFEGIYRQGTGRFI